jgi:hypothetical protein
VYSTVYVFKIQYDLYCEAKYRMKRNIYIGRNIYSRGPRPAVRDRGHAPSHDDTSRCRQPVNASVLVPEHDGLVIEGPADAREDDILCRVGIYLADEAPALKSTDNRHRVVQKCAEALDDGVAVVVRPP